MAISWGSWAGDMQVGIDITRTPSTVTKDTSSVSYRTKIYIGYRNGHNFNGTLTYTGYYGNGSQTYRLDHPWGGAAASRLLVDRSASYTIHYDKTVASNVYAETTVVWNGSKPSKKVEFTIPRRPYHTPRAPKSPSATRNSDTQATVTWTRDADSASGARPWSGVYIERQSASNTSWTRIATVTGTGTSYTDKGISANNRFRYRVISYNSAGSSSAVNTGYVITTPTSPNNVTATKDASGNILVKWTNRANYQTGVKVYDNGSLVATLTTAANQWTHGSPNPSITHTYTVRAVAGSLDSALSSPSNTVQLMAPPLAPTGFKAINSTVAQEDGDPIRFEWNHNPVDSSEQVARQFSYKVPGSSSWVTGTKWTTGNEWSLTPTPGGDSPTLGTWTWRVRTWGQDPDPSPWSSEITTVVENRPQIAVLSPASDSIIETNAVTASWNYSQAQGRAQRGRLLRLIDTTNGSVEVWRDERNTTSTSWAIPFTLQDDSQYQLAITVTGTNGLASQEQLITFGVDYLEPDPAEVNIDWDTESGYNNVGIHNPDTNPEVVSNRVFRNVDPDSPWSKVKPDATPQEPVFNLFTNPNLVGTGTYATVAENHFTNPRLVGDGTWAEVRRNLTYSIELNDVYVGSSTLGTSAGSRGFYFPVVAGDTLSFRREAPLSTRFRVAFTASTPAPGQAFISTSSHDSKGVVDGLVAPAGAMYVFVQYSNVDIPRPKILAEKSATAGNHFDGSTMDESMPQPEDFRVRWLGTPNASESVMEIERVAGLTAVNCVAGVSTRDGKPAMRLIPTGASSLSYAWSAIPVEARSEGTALGTIHLNDPLTGSLNTDALSIRVHNPVQRESAPNLAGEYPLRLMFNEITSGNTLRLYHGGSQGSGDVWWTDIGLYAGNYPYETFNGESDPAETGIAQPEDFRIRWTGEVDNSTSVMEIETVAGLYGLNAIAGVSTRNGKPAVRLIPAGSSGLSEAFAILSSVTASSVTGVGTVSLDAPLQGTLDDSALVLRVTGVSAVGVAAPNLAGDYPLRVMGGEPDQGFVALALTNGASQGNGDVWWTGIGLFAGDYTGPWFGGDGLYQDPESGLIVEDTWGGEPNSSHTQRVVRYPEFIDSEWELVGEAEANGSITDYEGLTYGTTAYAVDSITGIGSSSRSYKTIEVYDDRVWLSHYDTRRTAALFYNIKREFGSEKVNSELFDFDGRTDPVLIEGEAINSTLTVTGKIDPYGMMGTSWRDFERVAELAGMFVYRDKDGRRWYARLTGVSEQIDSSKRRNVTFTVTRLERPDNEPIQ